MTTFTSGLRRALQVVAVNTDTRVHFHVDADGRAFVCDLGRCDSPGMTLLEASQAENAARAADGRDALAA